MARKTEKTKLPDLLSPRELAAAWKCHQTTAVRILTRAGIQPVVFGSTRRGIRRYRIADVISFLEAPDKRSTEATPLRRGIRRHRGAG